MGVPLATCLANTPTKWKRTKKKEDMLEFLRNKKQYVKLCKTEKKKHEDKIQEKIGNVRNANEFWTTIKQFKPRLQDKSKIISMAEWTRHLFKCFPSINYETNLTLYDVQREALDSNFVMGEMDL
ncbi:uncharacterized protein LOC113472771, partial [Diaphorina citri]|uniref:Uncharacterized protein LOC113472771 n=1 Tax=Diaphorina citri TaxID=121845 RepID=A0A3Q0JMH7_DIACI